jgi:uncharacterized protein (TIGR03435 family)
MIRRMLADRFGPRFHREQREISVYASVIAKHGPKLQAIDPEGKPQPVAAPGEASARRPAARDSPVARFALRPTARFMMRDAVSMMARQLINVTARVLEVLPGYRPIESGHVQVRV